MTKYYSIITRDSAASSWAVQFGDYDRDVVADELADSYADEYAARIISTADDKASIDAAVAKLNGREAIIPPAAEPEAPARVVVDVTPTWAGLLPALLAVLESGNATGRKMAREELARMAAAADMAVAAEKAAA